MDWELREAGDKEYSSEPQNDTKPSTPNRQVPFCFMDVLICYFFRVVYSVFDYV